MLSEDQEKTLEENFPAMCHFRLVVDKGNGAEERIEGYLAEAGHGAARLEHSRESGGGKYVAYGLSLNLDTLQQMRQLGTELRALEGVRMVL